MRKRLLCMMLSASVGFSGISMTAYAANNSPTSEILQEQTVDMAGQGAAEEGVEATALSSISTANGRIENDQGGIDWSVTSDGVLTVEGKGDIAADNINGTLIPWSGMNFTKAVVRLQEATDLSYFFADCKWLTSVDFTGTDAGFVTDMSYMFNDCWQLHELDLTAFDTADVENMQGMFAGCKNLRSITWDRDKFDTSNVTNMNSMFMGCIHLTDIDLLGFNTGKVRDMSAMFQSCAKLADLDLTSFNTAYVTNMANMFWECTSLKSLNLGNFNTGCVTNMHEMFKNCSSLEKINISGFATGQVTDMSGMFEGTSRLKELDLSSFDMSRVTGTGTFIGGKDFWDEKNTALELIRSPRNLGRTVALPAAEGEIWYQSGGNTVTQLPRGNAESVLLQKNKQPEAGLTVNVSDSSKRPAITITFDKAVNLRSFSLKIDGTEVLNSDNWQQYYNAAGRKVIYRPEEDLAEGRHTLEVDVEDQDGKKYGTPVERIFTVATETPVDPDVPDTDEPENEIINKVVVVVNENYIRIRAWSPYDRVDSVEARVVEVYADDAASAEDGTVYPMDKGKGYYTTVIPIKDKTLQEVCVTVTGRLGQLVHSYDMVTVQAESAAKVDDNKVLNDLWIRFVDDEGEEISAEYIYTGKAIRPQVEVYEGVRLLLPKTDYTISYRNNKNAGTGTVVVKGKGQYVKSAEKSFTILPKNLNDEEDLYEAASRINIRTAAAVQKNKVQKPIPVISYGEMKLKADRDFTVEYPSKEEGAYQKAGTWEVKVKGRGNYAGEARIEYYIGQKLAGKLKVSRIAKQDYTGNAIEPKVTVKDGRNTLTPGTDYNITYRNNVNAGTAQLVITGIGPKYAGEKTVNFTIKGTAIGKAAGNLPSVEYNGEYQKPVIGSLIEGVHYKATYTNNLFAGTATVELTGLGEYSGTAKKKFKITPFNAKVNKDQMIRFDVASEAPYAKGGAKPEVSLYFGEQKLAEGIDYKLSFDKNKKIGEGTVNIQFRKNLKGTVSETYNIVKQDIGNLISRTQDAAYGKKKNFWKSKVAVVDLNGKKLVQDKDYEKVTTYYLDQECTIPAREKTYPAGTEIWVKVIGKGNYKGEMVTSFRVMNRVISNAKVRIAKQEYTTEPVVLDYSDIIQVEVGGEKLTPKKDYVIDQESYRNNLKKGKGEVTLVGTGDYGGSITVKFTITSKNFVWRALEEFLAFLF